MKQKRIKLSPKKSRHFSNLGNAKSSRGHLSGIRVIPNWHFTRIECRKTRKLLFCFVFFIDVVLVFGLEECTRAVFNSVASLRNKLQQGFEVFYLVHLLLLSIWLCIMVWVGTCNDRGWGWAKAFVKSLAPSFSVRILPRSTTTLPFKIK